MSYDYLMFKANAPIATQDDLSDSTVEYQAPDAVMQGLSRLFPAMQWKEFAGSWSASHQDDAGWYEFRVSSQPTQDWSISTSFRSADRPAIQLICRELGLVAFDGQAMTLIDADGERSAI